MTKILGTLAGVVYYLTVLVEQGERAKDLAAAHDIQVEVLFPKEQPLPTDAAVLVVALDSLWLDAHGRRQYLADLATNPPKIPTFVPQLRLRRRRGA